MSISQGIRKTEHTMRPVFMSLKPYYADLVFDGLKKVELRRRVVSKAMNTCVFVYVSSPTMELRGGFRIGQVWSGPPEEVWRSVYDRAAVDRSAFDAYFQGQSIAHALEIKDVWEYEVPIGLDALRSLFENFVVPQSWRYVKAEEEKTFQQMERRAAKV